MNTQLVQKLILYIVDQLTDMGSTAYKIRLVKLLYLIDVEYYRMRGTTLTGLEWFFYRYGPYAYAIDNALGSLGYQLKGEEFTSQYGKGFRYETTQEYMIDDVVDFATKATIDRVVNTWAFSDTNELLDYVYLSTPPMKDARYNSTLDFSSIIRTGPYQPKHIVKIDPDKKKFIQQRLSEAANEFDVSLFAADQACYDSDFYQAMAILDEEESDQARVVGALSIPGEVEQIFRRNTE